MLRLAIVSLTLDFVVTLHAFIISGSPGQAVPEHPGGQGAPDIADGVSWHPWLHSTSEAAGAPYGTPA